MWTLPVLHQVMMFPQVVAWLSGNALALINIVATVPMDVGHLPLLAQLSGTLCPQRPPDPARPRAVTGIR